MFPCPEPRWGPPFLLGGVCVARWERGRPSIVYHPCTTDHSEQPITRTDCPSRHSALTWTNGHQAGPPPTTPDAGSHLITRRSQLPGGRRRGQKRELPGPMAEGPLVCPITGLHWYVGDSRRAGRRRPHRGASREPVPPRARRSARARCRTCCPLGAWRVRPRLG